MPPSEPTSQYPWDGGGGGGGGLATSMVKLWFAFGETPLVAVTAIEYVPAVPAAGVPESRPPEVSDRPVGSCPVSLKAGGGDPVAVNENAPAEPAVNEALVPLVIRGATPTVRA